MGRKYAIDVLVFIYDNPGAMQKTITDHGGEGKVARRDRLNEMIDAGMIKVNSSGANWTAIKHYLTEDGERFVKMWLAFERGEEVEGTDHFTPQVEGDTLKS